MAAICPITPELAMSYKAVRLRALSDVPSAFGSTFQKESRLDDNEWIARAVRLCSNQAVGYLALDTAEYCGIAVCFLDEDDPQTAQLLSMWVAQRQRKTGIGRMLVEAVAHWAVAHGARRLRLMVTSSNYPAMDFYRKLGFSPTGRTEPYPNDPALEEYEMAKMLV